jgi:hypothetical protein
VAALLGLLVVLTAGAFAAVTLALIEAQHQQVQAEERRKDLLAINDDLRNAQNDLTAASWKAHEVAESSAHDGYFSAVGLAQRLWQAGDVAAARRELDRCPERFRHWEWQYLDRLCRADGVTIPVRGLPLHLSYTPDGQYLVCGMVSDRIALYRVADGQEVWKGPIWPASPPMLAVHRSGKRLAYVSPGKAGPTGPGRQVVRVVGIPGGEVQAEHPVPLLLVPDNPAVALAWDRDDRLLLGWFRKDAHPVTFETWDVAAKKAVATGVAFRPAPQMIVKIEMPAFSPDGRWLTAVAQDVGFVRPAARRGADEP